MIDFRQIFEPSNPHVLIVAELSGNHGGSIQKAKELIEGALAAGADAVKLQTYRADTITLKSDKPDFLLPTDSPWAKHSTLYDLYAKAHTPWEWHEELFAHAKKVGIPIFSSPFDETAVDLLDSLGAPAFKIASPEITHIPLITKVARLGKPVILSTGVAEKEDIDLAVKTLRDNGCQKIVVLKCTTDYPAPLEDSHLLTIPEMQKLYRTAVGLSDHALSHVPAICAVALGARVLEKHFIMSHNDSSVDGFFSLDFAKMKEYVSLVRDAEKTLGSPAITVPASAVKNLRSKRSLYVSADIAAGEVLSASNVKCVRPAFGLHPQYYFQILGRKVKRAMTAGDRLSLDDLADW